jgi:hypothetical protein
LRFAALESSNIFVGAVEHMQHSSVTHLRHIRNLAISACALAAFLGGAAANAGTSLTPQIYGSPPTTGVAGQYYTFTPTATGPSGYRLRFSIANRPAWGNFNTRTGQLSGTPVWPNPFRGIVISVSDGVATASLPRFTIYVTSKSTTTNPPPPTISGTPATADNVGTAYTFTPKASGPSGDTLSFSVQNLPSWATFSIASGTITGTPTAANVGTFANIVISVSDGTASATLAPFAINVSQPVTQTTGTATLSWTAPTTNTDGSALTSLAGYHIYYGTSPSALSTTINVANPGMTSYSVGSLASGTWYFTVNAYTTGGLDSGLSNMGSKTIP